MVNVGIRRWLFWVAVVGDDGERVVTCRNSDVKRCNNRYPGHTPILKIRLTLRSAWSTLYTRASTAAVPVVWCDTPERILEPTSLRCALH